MSWASPTFIISKLRKTVWMLTDFRKLNSKLVRKYFPILNISGIMKELEVFKWAFMLNSNIRYYTIRLDPHREDIYIIITPWGSIST